jgi:hypothetical protein
LTIEAPVLYRRPSGRRTRCWQHPDGPAFFRTAQQRRGRQLLQGRRPRVRRARWHLRAAAPVHRLRSGALLSLRAVSDLPETLRWDGDGGRATRRRRAVGRFRSMLFSTGEGLDQRRGAAKVRSVAAFRACQICSNAPLSSSFRNQPLRPQISVSARRASSPSNPSALIRSPTLMFQHGWTSRNVDGRNRFVSSSAGRGTANSCDTSAGSHLSVERSSEGSGSSEASVGRGPRG